MEIYSDELDDILNDIQKQVAIRNRTPMESHDNLSPEDVYIILHFTFSEESPIQYKKNIANETLRKVPFYCLFRHLLEQIKAQKQMPLTAKGNLQVKMVKELYGLGYIKDEFIEDGINKLNKQTDAGFINALKVVCDISGLTKKRNNKISLTKKGIKLLADKNELPLFKHLFETFVLKYNWGYLDGYNDPDMQHLFGYSLYLFLKYGKQKRDIDFYVDKNLNAFPMILENHPSNYKDYPPERRFRNCYHIRIFDRFLVWFDLMDTQKKSIRKSLFTDEIKVRSNKLLYEIFEIDASKFRFIRPAYQA